MLVQCVSVESPLGLGKGWSSPPSQVQPGWRRGGGGGGGGGRCSARVETDSDPARLAAAPPWLSSGFTVLLLILRAQL